MKRRFEAVILATHSWEFRGESFSVICPCLTQGEVIKSSIMGIFVAKCALYSEGVLLSKEGFLESVFLISD